MDLNLFLSFDRIARCPIGVDMLVYISVPPTWRLTDFAVHYGFGVHRLNCKTWNTPLACTGELGYDRLIGTRKISPSYAKSVINIWQILDMHWTGTKHIVGRMQKSVVQWSDISKFTRTIVCINLTLLHILDLIASSFWQLPQWHHAIIFFFTRLMVLPLCT